MPDGHSICNRVDDRRVTGADVTKSRPVYPETRCIAAEQKERQLCAAALPGVLVQRLVPFVNHDDPLEGTGGQEGVRIEQALDGEAPSGAGEPTRPPTDRRSFDNGENAGGLRQTGLPGKISGQRVAVGRCELKGSVPGTGREVNDVRDFYREPTQVRSVTRALYEHERERGVTWRDGNNPFQATFEGHLLSRRHGAGQRRCQEHRCHLQIDDGFYGGFHITFRFLTCCFFVSWSDEASQGHVRSAFVKGNVPSKSLSEHHATCIRRTSSSLSDDATELSPAFQGQSVGSGNSRFQTTLHALRFSASFNQDLITDRDLLFCPARFRENCLSSGFILRLLGWPLLRFSTLFRVCLRRRIPTGFRTKAQGCEA